MPSFLPQEDFVNSIRNNSSNVKTKFNDVTESLQFKRWFGKSKAVNRDGSPKILYHRTNADFTVFDIDRSGTNQGKTHGDGIYLSTSKDAFDYAGDKETAFCVLIYLHTTPHFSKICFVRKMSSSSGIQSVRPISAFPKAVIFEPP